MRIKIASQAIYPADVAIQYHYVFKLVMLADKHKEKNVQDQNVNYIYTSYG